MTNEHVISIRRIVLIEQLMTIMKSERKIYTQSFLTHWLRIGVNLLLSISSLMEMLHFFEILNPERGY